MEQPTLTEDELVIIWESLEHMRAFTAWDKYPEMLSAHVKVARALDAMDRKQHRWRIASASTPYRERSA